MRNWLLPEKFEDILPPRAQRIDRMRAKLLELFRVHGYQLVIPPMLEYLESLLTGTGHDLDLRTFKLVDQLSGRMMGVRADIAPQVARIDAHLLNRKGVARLCYAGSVLLTRPRGLDSTREPLQIGAEIYGHPGIERDLPARRGRCRARVGTVRSTAGQGSAGAARGDSIHAKSDTRCLARPSGALWRRRRARARPARPARVSRNRRGARESGASLPKRQHPGVGGLGRPSRISLPQRGGVCGLCAGRGQRD